MTDAFPIVARLSVGAVSPIVRTAIEAGPYEIRPVPSGVDGDYQLALTFQSKMEGDPASTNPEEEVELVANLLGLCLGAHVRVLGVLGNNVDLRTAVGGGKRRLDEDLLHFPSIVDSVLRLPNLLLRQFMHSAEAFTLAAEQAEANPTLAFFLLVVAVECLSSQNDVIPFVEIHPEGKTCERFVQFLFKYVPQGERGATVNNPSHFTQLLKTVYYRHRSGFVHGGRAVSPASSMADRLGLDFIKHVEDGKDIDTPSLTWFLRLVRKGVVSFAGEYVAERPPDRADRALATLAKEKAVLRFRVRRPVKRGQVVTGDDVELQ